VQFSPDGGYLATGSIDGTVRLYRLAPERSTPELHLVIAGHVNTIFDLAFDPSSRFLATASADATVRIWDISTPDTIKHEVAVLTGHTGPVYALAFSPGGYHLLTAGLDGTLRLWKALEWHSRPVQDVDFSPDGTRLATASQDESVRIWDVATSRLQSIYSEHTDWVNSAAFSPDGQWIASAGNDGTLRLWSADGLDTRWVTRIDGHLGCVDFNPAGDRISVCSDADNSLKLVDVATGTITLQMTGHTNWLTSAAFSPDGNRLATSAQDGTVRLWDAASGEQVRLIAHPEYDVTSVVFSSDGRRLVSSGANGSFYVWDVETGYSVMAPPAHKSIATSVAISPDNTKIATASYDKTVKLWATNAAGDPLQIYTFPAEVISIEFSPDSKNLAIGTANGQLYIYPLDNSGLLTLARQRLTRRMTALECRQYLQGGRCPAEETDSLPYTLDFTTATQGWNNAEGVGFREEWKDGAFELTVRAVSQTNWNVALRNYNDFALEVDSQLLAGEPGALYGLVFRYLDQSTAFFFAISQDGKYGLMRRTYGQNNWVIQPTVSNAIRLEEKNRLKVVCQGAEMKFYINDQYVASFKDDSYGSGDVGVFVDNQSAANPTHVRFDNLVVNPVK
jgi:WD40 repeat protein